MLFAKNYKEKTFNSINCAEWLQAEYEPLPGLVEAARRIFKNESLPQIKRARAARIPDSVNYIFSQIEEAKQKNKRKLILLSGVPGAGKTLVGLQLVHDSRLQGLRISAKGMQLLHSCRVMLLLFGFCRMP